MEKKRILVTGGLGFIGSHLVSKLVGMNNLVMAFDNFFTGKEEFISDIINDVEVFKGDLRNQDEIYNAVKSFSPSLIFHLAALHYIPYCNDNPIETIEVNVAGTENLLQAVKQCGKVEMFVFASSAAVYPIYDGQNKEDDFIAPTDIYGNTKYFGEHLIRTYFEESGTPCQAARLFNVYGNNETNPHVIPAILDQLLKSDKIQLGNMKPKRDYIFADDVADALIALADKNSQTFDTFNVGTGTEYSVTELVNAIEDICGKKVSVLQSESRTRKSDRLHLVPDVSKIKNSTGWVAKYDLRKGFETLIKQDYPELLNHR